MTGIMSIRNTTLLCFSFFLLVSVSCSKEIFYKRPKAEITLSGTRLNADIINLTKDTVYVLSQNLIRNANQLLSIEAGTLIKVKSNIGITVNAGGKMIAEGNKENPIVITFDGLKGTPQATSSTNVNAWGGILLKGSNTVTSGVLKFIRIEFAGSSNIASLSLNNIDKATVLDHIQVSYSSTASFEFNGGLCNATNLLAYASSGSDFLLRGGYKGFLQNIFAYRHPYNISSGSQIAGLHIQDVGTFPSISNFSVIGPDLLPGTESKYSEVVSGFSGSRVAALLVNNSGKFHIRNSVFAGFPKTGFYIDSRVSGESLQTNESDFTYSFVHSNDSSRAFYIPDNLIPFVPPITAVDFKNFMLNPLYNNQLILNTSTFKLTDPYNYNVKPNPVPAQGSPLLTGANFDGLIFSEPFFNKVSYRGAIAAENWLEGWTNFIPLQTDYNN